METPPLLYPLGVFALTAVFRLRASNGNGGARSWGSGQGGEGDRGRRRVGSANQHALLDAAVGWQQAFDRLVVRG